MTLHLRSAAAGRGVDANTPDNIDALTLCGPIRIQNLFGYIIEYTKAKRSEITEEAMVGQRDDQERLSTGTDSAAVAVAVPTRAWGSSQETKTSEAHTMLIKRMIILGMAAKIHESL